MRWMIAAASVAMVAMAWLGTGGCSLYGGGDGCDYDGHHYKPGETFPSTICGSCYCDPDLGLQCQLIVCDGGVDSGPYRPPDARLLPDARPRDGGPAPDAAPACAPSAGCADGPACGDRCCGAGEQCVGTTCMCGSGAACGAGDSCAPFGPGGDDLCGAVCCGISGPCPD